MIETTPTYEYEVIRRHGRRSVTLRVLEGKVQVLAPKRFPESHIAKVVQENTHWIARKLAEQACVDRYIPKCYVTGELFNYLGKPYALMVALGKPIGVMLRDKQLVVFVRPAATPEKKSIQIYRQLQQWYYSQALDYLQRRTQYYAEQLGVRYQSVTVRRFKSQWGSCSIHADIQYNWRIILAPQHIIDYLVAHELAHIKHHNHSPRFWRVVASMIPDYKACKQWLNKQGHLLRID